MENKKLLKVLLITIILLILVDQISKILVIKFLPEEKVLIQNVLAISKVENEGIAFGLNKQNLSNIMLTFLVLAIITRFLVTQKKNLNFKTTVFISMMIAGGISNVIDRIFRGAVFDFIKIGDFPVFNIADSIIVIGWILFVIDLIKNVREISK